MRIILGFGFGAALFGAVALAGCSGKTFTNDESQGAVTGGTCSPEGARADAADGCNTCECHSGAWSCTEENCDDDPNCTDGDQKPAGDGCNTCSCSDGQWQCTLAFCEPPPCVDG